MGDDAETFTLVLVMGLLNVLAVLAIGAVGVGFSLYFAWQSGPHVAQVQQLAVQPAAQ